MSSVHQSSVTHRGLIERLLESLRELPGVHANLGVTNSTPQGLDLVDAMVELNVAGKSITLVLEVKKTVYPRDVRESLWHFRSPQTVHSKTYYLLVAESLSPGAKELLKAESVGYYDTGGSLFLPIPGAYVYLDKPPPKTMEKSVRSLFSGRRAQVLHALLAKPQEWFGVTDIAEQARVAPSTASEVLIELERFDWLVSRGQGPSKERHLREPGALLDAWVKQLATLRPPVLRRYYVPGQRSDSLLTRLGAIFEHHQVAYAVSYEAAGQRYAPFVSSVSQVKLRLLPSAGADAALAELDARIVTEGANLTIIETKSPGELLFRQQVGDVWLASPIQVYLDLLRGEGRAKEMAEHLRREEIRF